MTAIDAIEIVVECKGQYPRMTEEQAHGLKGQLQTYSRGSAELALSDMVRHVEDWNTTRFLAIVRRRQIEQNDATQREQYVTQREREDACNFEYQQAIDAANVTPDDELFAMRDTLFGIKPDLRETYGADVDPRKRRSLLLLMFRPASPAARGL